MYKALAPISARQAKALAAGEIQEPLFQTTEDREQRAETERESGRAAG